jgi:hypothetical protein
MASGVPLRQCEQRLAHASAYNALRLRGRSVMETAVLMVRARGERLSEMNVSQTSFDLPPVMKSRRGGEGLSDIGRRPTSRPLRR